MYIVVDRFFSRVFSTEDKTLAENKAKEFALNTGNVYHVFTKTSSYSSMKVVVQE